jgi:hypothetical protein
MSVHLSTWNSAAPTVQIFIKIDDLRILTRNWYFEDVYSFYMFELYFENLNLRTSCEVLCMFRM